MYTCSYTHLTSQKERFLRRTAKCQGRAARACGEAAVADLTFTTIQHHTARGKRCAFQHVHLPLTFYVETCPFSGCTNKATRHRIEREPQQSRVTKWKSNSASAPLASSQANLGSIIQKGRGLSHPPKSPSKSKRDDSVTSLLLQRLGASLTKVIAFDRQGNWPGRDVLSIFYCHKPTRDLHNFFFFFFYFSK